MIRRVEDIIDGVLSLFTILATEYDVVMSPQSDGLLLDYSRIAFAKSIYFCCHTRGTRHSDTHSHCRKPLAYDSLSTTRDVEEATYWSRRGGYTRWIGYRIQIHVLELPEPEWLCQSSHVPQDSELEVVRWLVY